MSVARSTLFPYVSGALDPTLALLRKEGSTESGGGYASLQRRRVCAPCSFFNGIVAVISW
jgi:hypothetical protein